MARGRFAIGDRVIVKSGNGYDHACPSAADAGEPMAGHYGKIVSSLDSMVAVAITGRAGGSVASYVTKLDADKYWHFYLDEIEHTD